MKYLCAVYLEPNASQGLSAGEQAKLNRDSLDYNDELAKKGHYIAASARDDRHIAGGAGQRWSPSRGQTARLCNDVDATSQPEALQWLLIHH